jgi:hypothetical protein
VDPEPGWKLLDVANQYSGWSMVKSPSEKKIKKV